MKNKTVILLLFLHFILIAVGYSGNDVKNSLIRINQLGYLPHSVKVAVLCSKQNMDCPSFSLHKAKSGQEILKSGAVKFYGAYGPFVTTWRLNFSEFEQNGEYYIEAGGARSPNFRIGNNVYDGAADFLLKYMRQQRCGFNPFLNDSCHTQDGFTIYGPMPDGTHIDATGGWHDAADYLQYVTTSANAAFNLAFAYRENPASFNDEYLANGLPGKNGVADVLDEARWGLDWLIKMHPRHDWMFNQIADDRDHAGFRLPNQDSVVYGEFPGRPVYFCTGEVQGLFKYKNRATGVASTAGKFASAFAVGADVFNAIDKNYASLLAEKAKSAYELGLKKPGACQTAPGRAPYFYEEDNWIDDMELGAAALFNLTKQEKFQKDGVQFSGQENITPWMGADTARHYQWYPFFNAGHYELARNADPAMKKQLMNNYQRGVEAVFLRGKNNAFQMGVPFIWCSNNLVSAFVTQIHLYQKMSGDKTYAELEAAMRDWLFGCNPWGVSMVVGLPENGVYPKDVHSSLWTKPGYKIDGGLVDGPVYGSIFKRLQYLRLSQPDEYAEFQSDLAVYHDDFGDYSTNEPTMDGTATLVYYLAAMQSAGAQQRTPFQFEQGAIIRGDRAKKEIALVFTGGDFADGGRHIRQILADHQIKAGFFFTGVFYRQPAFQSLIKDLKTDGHYLGAHSNKHLLYCDWTRRDSLLVTKDQFQKDLLANYTEMRKFGIEKQDALYFLPPFEWYNDSIGDWTKEIGLQLINYSPGTRSTADYTTPDMGARYVDSKTVYESIISFEKKSANGLNGFVLLSHIGTHPARVDKFYKLLDPLIRELKNRGYIFKRIDELLMPLTQ